ncbi:unnamed protein product [Ilex paraguariensis]|uniref:Uncharacterized protein n=1 Tax=Ilex paraguariensis TaxID=185542 RepID=A0ABC8T1H1_9AQUA
MAIINLFVVVPTEPKFFRTFTSQPGPPRTCTLCHAPTTTSCAGSPDLVQCSALVNKPCDQAPIRRSANYQPPIWAHDYVQSLTSDYQGSKYTERSDELKRHMKMMLEEEAEPLDQLELIDNLQRLGVSYQFEDEIKSVMENIYNNGSDDKWHKEDLYATALGFRLLRQHGYNVSQEIFNSFRNSEGNLKPNLCEDTKGMLSLYEASHLAVGGESVLEKAREFITKHLKEKLDEQKIDQNLAIFVDHALELPLHWRVPRLEARWFIEMYEKRPEMNPILLELAKLDFNVVQAIHRSDLKFASRWWKGTGLGEKLKFARDRLMENFLWTVGVIFEPQYGYCRRMLTKINALVTTIDDVYDVYGTLDELQFFTNAVDRWDINAMEQLPEYMQICFLALYNSINEMAYDSLTEQGVQSISYLRKGWADLCKSYLQEANWYFNGYTPTLEEYLENAWVSISAPLILVHLYFLASNPITTEALECLDKYHDIIRWSSMILRLADDLGTSSDEMKRGDVPKSIQCYMNQTGASEEDAREHIRFLIRETWKKLNEDRVADSPFSQSFIAMAVNLGRMAQCMYQHGDGHASQGSATKERILALLIEPIPLT